jgi:CubicO group peptidase (beta-lactamase class C family)
MPDRSTDKTGAILPIMQGSPPKLRVPREDWDRAPWNRWSFQHIREILPTAEVWRGNNPPHAFKHQPRHLAEISFDTARGPMTVAQYLDASFTDGFLVLHKGAVVSESYFNNMGARSLHLSQSVAKSLTGVLAGIFAGRGQLDPKALITQYLPELAATAYRGATVQHALDMMSGVAYSEEYTDPFSDVGQTDVASGWKLKPAGDSRAWPETMWDQILGLTKQEAPHGARFSYRSIETDVVAFVLERISGKRLPELISSEIWQKLGAEESACYTVDAGGYALADGGFNATLRDYARFGQMIAQDGWFHGSQIVPKDWIAETRRGKPDIFDAETRKSMPRGSYHNQFWIEDVNTPVLQCLGVFGQWIYADPENDFVAVKLSSWPDFLDDGFYVDGIAAIHAIKRTLRQG